MNRRMVTTDCHIAPPPTLFDEIPSKYRQYFPRLERRADGAYLVRPQPTQTGMGTSAATQATAGMGLMRPAEMRVDTDDDGARLSVGNVCQEARPSFDPQEQLADLERDGVYGAVLIGRFGGFDLHPLDVDIAFCQLVNDYLADTWRPYFDRVAPGIHLPIQNIEASVKELERAAGLGLRPALLPDGIFERPYFLPEWEPLWEALNALKVPATCHVGNNAVPGKTDHGIPPGLGYIGWYDQCVAMGESLGHMVFSGVFERYPDLQVVMTEGYATWLAFAVQFWDHHWLDSRFSKMEGQASMLTMGEWAAKIEAPPGYYLKRNCHATFMWDPIAVREREVTGLDCLLWGNDYPHREGSFPDSEAWIDKMFAGVPEEEIDQMVRGNANRIFGLNV